MGKATLRSAVLLALLAMGMAATAMPSFAETQNVRVGGDITTRAFIRSNLDLRDGNDISDTQPSDLDDHDRFIQTTTGLNINADMTDNVSAGIRLANELVLGDYQTNSDNNDFAVSQAWVKLKDLFFSPLTVTLGRQPIVWGRGFVLGSSLIPHAGLIGELLGSLAADEFTDFTAFDGARLTLDFQGAAAVDLPLTVDAVYIKLEENTVGIADDNDLTGVNLGTRFDAANAEIETYFLNKRDRSNTPAANLAVQHANVSTLGVRGSAAPVEGVYLYGELAYQFGVRARDGTNYTGLATGDRHQAWAGDFGVEYTAKDVAMTPKLGAEWIFWTGKDVDGAVTGWDPIARGYFTTALREFQAGAFYPVDQACTTGAGNVCTPSVTNQHQLSVYGSVKPTEDLEVAPRLTWFIADDGLRPRALDGTTQSKRKSFLGTEWDTIVTYHYTPDVTFGVIHGVFFPGNVFRKPYDAVAQELVTTVGVKF
ncbi:MAG: alginate export family protein [Candidatus Omnitrophica bacterium]|nr:alginate export family protein [Candidatus Omnitrophota bacterium]